jgi:Golgi SNAP receptor complex protein 2
MHTKLKELQKLTQQIESQWRILVVQENSSKRNLWKRKAGAYTRPLFSST